MPRAQPLQCRLCRHGDQHVLELQRDHSRDVLEIRLNHVATNRVELYRYQSVWEAFDVTWMITRGLPRTDLIIVDSTLLASYSQGRPADYDPVVMDPLGRPLGQPALPPSLRPAPQDPGGGFATLLGMRVMIDPDLPADALYFVDQHGRAQERITGVADEYTRAVIRPDGTVPNPPPPPADVLDMETLQRAFRRLSDARLEATHIVVSPRVHAELTRLYTDPTGRRQQDPGAPPPRTPQSSRDLKSDDPMEDL